MRLNPFARVEALRGPDGAIDGLRIVAPVKGRGLQTNVIRRAGDERTFVARRRAVLSALLDAEQARDAGAASDPGQHTFLRQSGLFVEDRECPAEVDPPCVCLPREHLTADPDQLTRRGVVIVREFFSASALARLRDYYTHLIDEGFAQYGGEGGESHRWVLHNDDAGRILHACVPRSEISSSFVARRSSIIATRSRAAARPRTSRCVSCRRISPDRSIRVAANPGAVFRRAARRRARRRTTTRQAPAPRGSAGALR